jgi:hypothetical protein
MRTEQEVFRDLTCLCGSPGYIHALAFLFFKNDFVWYRGKINSEDLLKKYSWDRLIRNEFTTLIGLLIETEIDFDIPPAEAMQRHINDTCRLMEELHESMASAFFAGLTPDAISDPAFNPFGDGSGLREAIFYSGESAYSFQFRDFAVEKYSSDDAWLEQNKGFRIQSARDVVEAICRIQNERVTATLHALRNLHPSEWTFLPGFSLTCREVAKGSGVPEPIVRNVLDAFSISRNERNDAFRSLHDFNQITATPIIRRDSETFILLGHYGLVQALYDSPFYWMVVDREYVNTAMDHRGSFTEEFSRKRLAHVFGDKKVWRDIKVYRGKELITDIDVLVLFGNRAIIVQAKSKRLTLEARRGNDGRIKDDFKKSIQDSYDQALEAAKTLGSPLYSFVDATGTALTTSADLKEIYIFCVVSDFYPALNFQAKQFLRYESTAIIRTPIVTEIFALDAMTEMLESPLQFLSFVNRRTGYSEKLFAPDELTILSMHLKQNLWLDDKNDLVYLSDDISCSLDAAMTVRRENMPGERTPSGILTKFKGTTLDRMISEIEARPDGPTIDFGFFLLTLDEEAFNNTSKGTDELAARTLKDGSNHDFSIASTQACSGLTVHCNNDLDQVAADRLRTHCHNRKYMQKANRWFGICIAPNDKSLRFGLILDFPWKADSWDGHQNS